MHFSVIEDSILNHFYSFIFSGLTDFCIYYAMCVCFFFLCKYIDESGLQAEVEETHHHCGDTSPVNLHMTLMSVKDFTL